MPTSRSEAKDELLKGTGTAEKQTDALPKTDVENPSEESESKKENVPKQTPEEPAANSPGGETSWVSFLGKTDWKIRKFTGLTKFKTLKVGKETFLKATDGFTDGGEFDTDRFPTSWLTEQKVTERAFDFLDGTPCIGYPEFKQPVEAGAGDRTGSVGNWEPLSGPDGGVFNLTEAGQLIAKQNMFSFNAEHIDKVPPKANGVQYGAGGARIELSPGAKNDVAVVASPRVIADLRQVVTNYNLCHWPESARVEYLKPLGPLRSVDPMYKIPTQEVVEQEGDFRGRVTYWELGARRMVLRNNLGAYAAGTQIPSFSAILALVSDAKFRATLSAMYAWTFKQTPESQQIVREVIAMRIDSVLSQDLLRTSAEAAASYMSRYITAAVAGYGTHIRLNLPETPSPSQGVRLLVELLLIPNVYLEAGGEHVLEKLVACFYGWEAPVKGALRGRTYLEFFQNRLYAGVAGLAGNGRFALLCRMVTELLNWGNRFEWVYPRLSIIRGQRLLVPIGLRNQVGAQFIDTLKVSDSAASNVARTFLDMISIPNQQGPAALTIVTSIRQAIGYRAGQGEIIMVNSGFALSLTTAYTKAMLMLDAGAMPIQPYVANGQDLVYEYKHLEPHGYDFVAWGIGDAFEETQVGTYAVAPIVAMKPDFTWLTFMSRFGYSLVALECVYWSFRRLYQLAVAREILMQHVEELTLWYASRFFDLSDPKWKQWIHIFFEITSTNSAVNTRTLRLVVPFDDVVWNSQINERRPTIVNMINFNPGITPSIAGNIARWPVNVAGIRYTFDEIKSIMAVKNDNSGVINGIYLMSRAGRAGDRDPPGTLQPCGVPVRVYVTTEEGKVGSGRMEEPFTLEMTNVTPLAGGDEFRPIRFTETITYVSKYMSQDLRFTGLIQNFAPSVSVEANQWSYRIKADVNAYLDIARDQVEWTVLSYSPTFWKEPDYTYEKETGVIVGIRT